MDVLNPLLRKLCSAGLATALLLQTPLAAAERGEPGTIPAEHMTDVVLGDNGALQARIVDLQGRPVVGESVTITHNGRDIAVTTSNADGIAAVSGLRQGVHSINTPMATRVCRFWNPDTAPPAAIREPAVVSDADIVRGQFGAFNLPMLVYAGVSAAALIIALDAEGDADDARDANRALRARIEALENASP